ncbi:uncharacterized protein LOC116171711 [Photinus pyralis]|uniref:uncharacterized protein LOC116171711 n=1 Tax=Photinus pyralis TaxID=7054 RepID=UPI0012674542|nr:uncharacterized protein LOC116171711 [Photinus pyralis]
MIIFARKRKNDQLMRGAPVNSVSHLTQSGWMDQEGFIMYLRHFATYSHCSPENPVLLILDGHASHKTLSAILKARELGIQLLTIPPHTSHRLQPLDRTFFGPLNIFYNQECSRFMTNNPGKRISVYDIAELFNKGYLKAATMNNAIKGFQTTGIWPFNNELFTEVDYVNVYDKDKENIINSENTIETHPPDREQPRETTPPPGDENPLERYLNTPTRNNEKPQEEIPSSCSTKASRLSRVEEISPLPIATRSGQEKGRKVQKSDILTSTPYKDALESPQNVDGKKRKAASKKLDSDNGTKSITKSIGTKPSVSISKPTKKAKKSKKYKRTASSSSSNMSDEMSIRDSSSDDDIPIHFCLICKEQLAEPPDQEIIMCAVCKNWAHEDCTDFEPRKKITYVTFVGHNLLLLLPQYVG